MEKFTIKDVTADMRSATDFNIHWWAFIHMEESLASHENALRLSEDQPEEVKGFIRYNIVETKKILVELYNKLTAFEEYKSGLIEKPDWMDEFLNAENS